MKTLMLNQLFNKIIQLKEREIKHTFISTENKIYIIN